MNRLRYLLIQLVMILPLAMWGQASSDEYDPPSPGDPTPPTIVRKSTLTLKAVPEEGVASRRRRRLNMKSEARSTSAPRLIPAICSYGGKMRMEQPSQPNEASDSSYRKRTRLSSPYTNTIPAARRPPTPSDKEPKYPLTAVITPEEGEASLCRDIRMGQRRICSTQPRDKPDGSSRSFL